MTDPASILDDAIKAPGRSNLEPHLSAIRELRENKKWTWREIADFLTERGVETDHTKLLRFMQRVDSRLKVPTADEYYEALQKLRRAGALESTQWAMLWHLYRTHNRTATYTELSHAAARAGAKVSDARPHTYANLEFGKLGKLLGDTVGMEFWPSSIRDKPFYSSAIGAGSSLTPPGGEFQLVMHHELAKALDRLHTEEKWLNGPELVESHE